MKVQYINSYKCVLVASAKDKLPLIIVLENTMASKSTLIKSNLIDEMINQLRQQMKNKMQVKAESNWFRISL